MDREPRGRNFGDQRRVQCYAQIIYQVRKRKKKINYLHWPNWYGYTRYRRCPNLVYVALHATCAGCKWRENFVTMMFSCSVYIIQWRYDNFIYTADRDVQTMRSVNVFDDGGIGTFLYPGQNSNWLRLYKREYKFTSVGSNERNVWFCVAIETNIFALLNEQQPNSPFCDDMTATTGQPQYAICLLRWDAVYLGYKCTEYSENHAALFFWVGARLTEMSSPTAQFIVSYSSIVKMEPVHSPENLVQWSKPHIPYQKAGSSQSQPWELQISLQQAMLDQIWRLEPWTAA